MGPLFMIALEELTCQGSFSARILPFFRSSTLGISVVNNSTVIHTQCKSGFSLLFDKFSAASLGKI